MGRARVGAIFGGDDHPNVIGLVVPVEDELHREMLQMLATKTLTMWLVFATQVYVDIRYILESDVDRAHEELMSTGKRITQIFEFMYEPGPDELPGSYDEMNEIAKEVDM